MNHTQSTAAAVCPQTESSDTGNATLDELVADLMPEAAAAALAAIEICHRDETFSYGLRDALRARLSRFLANEDGDGERDPDAELMPTSRWLAFLDGYLAAHRREDGE